MLISSKRDVSPIEQAAASSRHAPHSDAPRSSIQTKVTLSETARQPRSPASGAAHADPKVAEDLAYTAAYTEDAVHLDITDWANGAGPVRVKSTGEPYTPEFESRFKAEAGKLREARIELYTTEKAKGTSAADIHDMLEVMFNDLPEGYRDMVRTQDK